MPHDDHEASGRNLKLGDGGSTNSEHSQLGSAEDDRARAAEDRAREEGEAARRGEAGCEGRRRAGSLGRPGGREGHQEEERQEGGGRREGSADVPVHRIDQFQIPKCIRERVY